MVLPVALALALTFISPFINAWIQDVNWSPTTKNLLAILTSAIIATGFLAITGGIGDWTQLGVVIPAIYGLQQAIYSFFLKNIATKFEAITSKGSVVVSVSDVPGQVNVTSDTTIKATGDNISVDPPAKISIPATDGFVREPEVKG